MAIDNVQLIIKRALGDRQWVIGNGRIVGATSGRLLYQKGTFRKGREQITENRLWYCFAALL